MAISSNYMYDYVWVPPYCYHVGMELYYDCDDDGKGVVYFKSITSGDNWSSIDSDSGAELSGTVTSAVSVGPYTLSHAVSRMYYCSSTVSMNRLNRVTANAWNEMEIMINSGLRAFQWRFFSVPGYGAQSCTSATSAPGQRYIPDQSDTDRELVPPESYGQNWASAAVYNGMVATSELPVTMLRRAYFLAAGRIRFSPWRIGLYHDSQSTI